MPKPFSLNKIPPSYMALAACLFAFALNFNSVGLRIISSWHKSRNMGGHGAILLCISILFYFLFFSKIKKGTCSLSGVYVIAFSLILLAGGIFLKLHILQNISLTAYVFGVLLFWHGPTAVYKLWIVWFFMILSLPGVSFMVGVFKILGG